MKKKKIKSSHKNKIISFKKKLKPGSFIFKNQSCRRPKNRLTKTLWSLANPLYPCKSSKYINYHIT